MTSPIEIRVFVSYSHLDEKCKDELLKHLSFLKKYGDKVWHDRKIDPGSEWKNTIHEELHRSNIILLLISSNFLASRYCYEVEFKQALKRHESLDAVVVPIIIHDVYWQWQENKNVKGIADLNVLPIDGKAVSNSKYWASEHEAFTNIAKGIEKIISELITQPPVGTTDLTHAQRVAAKFFISSSGNIDRVNISNLDNNHFNKIYLALSNLNFVEQRKKFNQFLYSETYIGSFLLQGKRGYGQDWVLNELLRQLPNEIVSTAISFKFSFGGSFAGTLEDLWYELGTWVGIDSNEPSKIVEAVYTLWQTKTLIFVLRDIDPRRQFYLQEFLQAFWYPLTMKARDKQPTLLNYCVLFSVSYSDHKWEIMPHEHFKDICSPIELKRLTRFRLSELKGWMNREYRLPPEITVEKILENSQDGLPELVFRNICKLSGDNWKRREKAWIRY